MSSAAKAAANRANATLSTGPSNTSRTRWNGLSHGLTSKQTVIPGENQEEYNTFEAALRSDLKPESPIESLLVERVIAAAWRLKRFTRVESAFYANRIEALLADNPGSDPDAAMASLFSDPAESARMRLFLRYQASVQKEYDAAMRELRKVRAERAETALERKYINQLESAVSAPVTELKPILVGFASQMADLPRHEASRTRPGNATSEV